MEDVPRAFCDFVSTFMENWSLGDLENLCSNAWNAAGRDQLDDPVDLQLGIQYVDNVWRCDLGKLCNEELKRINPRQLRVYRVNIDNWGTTYNPALSLEEIFRIIDFTQPFLYRPHLSIDNRRSNPPIPSETLSQMLKRFRDKYFSTIDIWDTQGVVQDFLMHQLESTDALQCMCLLPNEREYYSDEVRKAVEEFAISKPFSYLAFPNRSVVFDRTFFGRLFE